MVYFAAFPELQPSPPTHPKSIASSGRSQAESLPHSSSTTTMTAATAAITSNITEAVAAPLTSTQCTEEQVPLIEQAGSTQTQCQSSSIPSCESDRNQHKRNGHVKTEESAT